MNKKCIFLIYIMMLFPFVIMCSRLTTSSQGSPGSINATTSDIANPMQQFMTNSMQSITNMLDVVADPKEAARGIIRRKYSTTSLLTDDQLQVRQGQSLCSKELNFIQNRIPKVTQALKKSFDIDAPLKIGLCCSGGGNRAMLVSLGFLLGAQDIGLYDTAYYMAGLSGSTWTIAPFSYLSATQNMSLAQFQDQLTVRLGSLMKEVIQGAPAMPVFSEYQKSNIQNNLTKRFAYGQYPSSIDIYGAFIGDFTLFSAGSDRLDVTWSSIADKIQQGNIPLPMGSAVSDKASGKDNYYWFELGPFEVGSDQIKSYVPIQGFGSKFKNGRPVAGYTGHTPEYSLGFYEGVFGSAFTVTMSEMDRFALDAYKFDLSDKSGSLSFADLLSKANDNMALSDHTKDNLRFFPATFHNYSLGLQGNPVSKEEKLELYDAGINFNLPLPLLMRSARNIDLIVACDAMVDLDTLKSAAIHFKRNNIKFPDISKLTQTAISKPLTVLNDPRMKNYDKDMVTILYCPFIKNDGFSTTFDPEDCIANGFCTMLNFNYTKEQAELVIGLTRYNVNSIKSQITAVLQALQQKKFQKTAENISVLDLVKSAAKTDK